MKAKTRILRRDDESPTGTILLKLKDVFIDGSDKWNLRYIFIKAHEVDDVITALKEAKEKIQEARK